MKIALCALNGSWSHTNLAIRCLRAPLVREGFEVVLCEHTLRDRTAHIIEGLAGECADVYGFSCYIWNIVPLLDIAHALHQIRPHAKIILGGPEVSFATERFATLDYIDAIVCGEGEEAMLEICQKIAQNQSFSRIISKNPLPYMRNEGILYQNGEHTGEILYYESSRGCPFRCAYCLSSTDTHPRYKTVEQTIDDLKAFERLDGGCKIIKFVDRTFNFNIDRANQIWRALLSDTFSKHYHFEVCATLLNEESFEIFAQFPKGKIQLEIGLQSTHIPTLEASARHLSPEKTIATAKRIFEMGNIHVHLDLIAGLPYETYARFAQSFDDAYGSCHMLQLGFLKLLHGTALREHKEQYGYAFLQNPPYTVLQNNWMSYEDLQKLSHMAEVLDRYFESGRFAHTLWYLTPLMTSPFHFWEGLTTYIRTQDHRPLQRISQPDAYRYLLLYAKEALPVLEDELREMLRADFREGEHKAPPHFL
ncbi:MAG: DUF4080 domain-containing protein [Clostridia bacterium]|nr:DUF4080 domain-containing protein [Clostridia bacterium]